ncbi:branched-chain amino acid ABC transporter substrate-binding protein [Terrihabitans sp. B22-R8]|uniref:branched-chain amino acid ABC transporter substrate-binding protein n=1 Tax=Terrihabitans sp. B22-R8 TaxID=3425128 RepID=UPI00403C6DC8
MTRKLLTGLLLGTALTVASGAQAQEAIKIALQGPITGAEATFGAQMKVGAEAAVRDINAAGGVLGKQIQLSLEDDKCDGTEATSVANRIAGSGVVFVAGSFCSGASIPASSVYAESGIVQISPASTNPKFTDQRPGPGIYRVCGRDDQQGPTAAAYIMKNFPGKNVAFLHDKSPYGEGLASETEKAFKDAGGKPVLSDSFNKGDTDFSALVSKLKQAKVDLVYTGTYHTEAGNLLKQLRQQGVQATLMAGDALVSDQFWTVAGTAGEGTLMTFSPDPAKDPKNADIVKSFNDAGIKPEGYVLYTYAAIQAWKAAVEAAKTTEAAAVIKQLDDGKFPTVIGEIDFDDKGDVTLPGYVVYQWKAGAYDYATN